MSDKQHLVPMHFTVLRSGSGGNCSLVEYDSTRVLIDAGGQTQKGLSALLDEADVDPAKISAVLITHLHGDHLNIATLRLAQQYEIPLCIHDKNSAGLSGLYKKAYRERVAMRLFSSEAFSVGLLDIVPFPLSHDAVGVTCGFRIFPSDSTRRVLVYAADLGHVPDTVVEHLSGAHTILLESNHDPEMLWRNPLRPNHHKKRVTGNWGHLSNEQCADALVKVVARNGRAPARVILGHLSADHNTPHLALETVGTVLSREGVRTELVVAPRDSATPRFVIDDSCQ